MVGGLLIRSRAYAQCGDSLWTSCEPEEFTRSERGDQPRRFLGGNEGDKKPKTQDFVGFVELRIMRSGSNVIASTASDFSTFRFSKFSTTVSALALSAVLLGAGSQAAFAATC